MADSWNNRVVLFSVSAINERPEATLKAMGALVEEHGVADPDALYKWASVHDFLASSLRNVSDPGRAIELLGN